MDGPNLQRFLVDADVYLAPDAALWAPVLAGVPLAFAFGLDAGRQIEYPALPGVDIALQIVTAEDEQSAPRRGKGASGPLPGTARHFSARGVEA